MALLMSATHLFAQNSSPLCFTARNGSVTVKFDIKNATHTIQYSTDGTSWSTYTSKDPVTISADQSVYFRAESNQESAVAFADSAVHSQFDFSSTNGGTVEGSGNIMSLYGPDCPALPLQPYAFAALFEDCKSLTKAPTLPATTLAESCYRQMFFGCTSLKVNETAPGKEWSIPASKTANGSLTSMFSGTSGTMNGTPKAKTIYFIASDPTTAIDDVDACAKDFVVFSNNRQIVVRGAEGHTVTLYDITGCVVAHITNADDTQNFTVSATGIYMVCIDKMRGAKKVVVR